MLSRLAVLVLLGLLVVAPLSAVASPPTYTPVLVSPRSPIAGEPSIASDGSFVYVTGPGAGNTLFVSSDGGATFHQGATTQGGGGDADVVIDGDGTVYVSDLLSASSTAASSLPVSVSTDHGATFTRFHELLPNAGTGVTFDREWNVAWGHGNMVEVARAGSTSSAWITSDAGVSFTGPVTVASDVNIAGRLIRSPDGKLWMPYENSGGLAAAVSGDGGHTWSSRQLFLTPSNAGEDGTTSFALFPSLAADDTGNLYVAVTLYGPAGATVWFSRSLDAGATWSAPGTLSSTALSPLLAPTCPTECLASSPSALMPWVSAGKAGSVAVAWYQARETVGTQDLDFAPEVGLPTTVWDVMVATSSNAAGVGAPTWDIQTAAPAFHSGSICTGGLTFCPNPGQAGVGNFPAPFDRRVLDFFSTTIDSTGHLLIAFPHDRSMTQCVTGFIGTEGCFSGDLILNWNDIDEARQTGGTLLR